MMVTTSDPEEPGEIPVNSITDITDAHYLSGGKINPDYLPSYVDDVVEVENFDSLPESGEEGKIYVTTDTGTTWRWSGSQYIKIGFDDDTKEEFLEYFLEQDFIIDAN
jgi:hypothetical protein